MPPCISARITLPNEITITVWGLRIPRKVWAPTIEVLQGEDPKICLPSNLNVDAVKVQTIWSEIALLAFAKLVVSVAMIVGIKRVNANPKYQ